MNREILFKAKRIDNGEWIEGYYEKYNNHHYINKETDRLDTGGYPIKEFIEVDENTICQYTGLTDKHGNKIWENDIVLKIDTNALGYHRERICTVSFDKNGYWKLTTILGDGYWIGEFDEAQLEVKGNIFDNADLLGKE